MCTKVAMYCFARFSTYQKIVGMQAFFAVYLCSLFSQLLLTLDSIQKCYVLKV